MANKQGNEKALLSRLKRGEPWTTTGSEGASRVGMFASQAFELIEDGKAGSHALGGFPELPDILSL
jgi:hypothetical protein